MNTLDRRLIGPPVLALFRKHAAAALLAGTAAAALIAAAGCASGKASVDAPAKPVPQTESAAAPAAAPEPAVAADPAPVAPAATPAPLAQGYTAIIDGNP